MGLGLGMNGFNLQLPLQQPSMGGTNMSMPNSPSFASQLSNLSVGIGVMGMGVNNNFSGGPNNSSGSTALGFNSMNNINGGGPPSSRSQYGQSSQRISFNATQSVGGSGSSGGSSGDGLKNTPPSGVGSGNGGSGSSLSMNMAGNVGGGVGGWRA